MLTYNLIYVGSSYTHTHTHTHTQEGLQGPFILRSVHLYENTGRVCSG